MTISIYHVNSIISDTNNLVLVQIQQGDKENEYTLGLAAI